MPRADRQPIVEQIETLRGRRLVTLMNFDRPSNPVIPGLNTQFDGTVKEPLFRVLKELKLGGEGIDLFLYTRGGDTNSVWPIVNLIREFDPEFEVLVPFRCHSSGTLLAIAAKRIVMGRLAELSPFDPTTGNPFNPRDPANPAPNARLGISVEDVQAYRRFVLDQFGVEADGPLTDERARLCAPSLERLSAEVHPLALGNVYRVHQQIKRLARDLLNLNAPDGEEDEKRDETISALTTELYSHQHMIGRHEAAEHLGARIVHADRRLDELLDALLGAYKKDFELWRPYFPADKMANEPARDQRFIGGVVESVEWSYLFETKVAVRQFSVLPEGVKLQIDLTKPMPLLPGFPRRFTSELKSQCWVRNAEPIGVDK